MCVCVCVHTVSQINVSSNYRVSKYLTAKTQNKFKKSVYGGKDGYVSDELCDGDVGEMLMEQQ